MEEFFESSFYSIPGIFIIDSYKYDLKKDECYSLDILINYKTKDMEDKNTHAIIPISFSVNDEMKCELILENVSLELVENQGVNILYTFSVMLEKKKEEIEEGYEILLEEAIKNSKEEVIENRLELPLNEANLMVNDSDLIECQDEKVIPISIDNDSNLEKIEEYHDDIKEDEIEEMNEAKMPNVDFIDSSIIKLSDSYERYRVIRVREEIINDICNKYHLSIEYAYKALKNNSLLILHE